MGIGRVTQVMGPVIDVRFEHNEVLKLITPWLLMCLKKKVQYN